MKKPLKLGHNRIIKSVGQLILGLMIFSIVFFLVFYWQARGYKKYVVYVQVKDEAIFIKRLNPSDPHILNYGRKLKEEIIAIDIDRDSGNGPGSGKLRWYVCKGIDCDEGWETRFIKND